MADPISFGVFDLAGAPDASASPAFLLYVDRTGAARAAPLIVNDGQGGYSFEPTAADEAVGACFVLDAGLNRTTAGGGRYLTGTVPDAAAFECFGLTDGAGALWVGAAPTFAFYEDRTGAALAQPSIVALGSGAYTFTPSSADVAAGVRFRVDAPALAFPAFLFGSATAPTVGPYSPPSAGTYPADAVAQLLAGVIALPNPPGGANVTLVYAAGGNLMVGPLRAEGASVPVLAVAVLQAGGPAPMPYMGQSSSWHLSLVQVTVRSPIDQFQRGEALARALHARAHLNTPPSYTLCLASESDPVYLGTTDGGSHLHVFNLQVGHRR